MTARWVLIQSKMDAIVEVLPEPEAPVTRRSPDDSAASFSTTRGSPRSAKDIVPGKTRRSTTDTEPR